MKCEYPDAPPTLTDLSQKVLDLYDTLKELEGELLVPYLQTMEQPLDGPVPDSPIESSQPNNGTIQQPTKRQRRLSYSSEPSSVWSMSLTSMGLSIQATVRHIAEFYRFAQDLSRQLCRDFGISYLPPHWEIEEDGYADHKENGKRDEDEEEEEEEPEEDEYLITIPIYPTADLLPIDHKGSFKPNNSSVSLPPLKELLEHVYSTKLRPTSIQVIFLMDQLATFLPPSLEAGHNELQTIYIYTAYTVSSLFAADERSPSSELWKTCAEHVMDLLFETMITDTGQTYALVLCTILIGYVYTATVVASAKVETLIYLAGRQCIAAEKSGDLPWQALVGCLVYLDIYAAAFGHRRYLLCGDGATALWHTVAQKRVSKDSQTVIVLEAQAIRLLNQVLSLLYTTSDEMHLKKVDVDDILTLIRDIEIWEHALPPWAEWTSNEGQRPSLTNHMHMIHNLAKILLFRPLCKYPKQSRRENDHDEVHKEEVMVEEEEEDEGENEQTHTRTTFLDLSVASIDRLASCLIGDDHWARAAAYVARDVLVHVRGIFENDEEIQTELESIEQRLRATEQKIRCKIKND
ncbi:hypothetical protein EC973_003461 [Apophysomyces ossiformis]|uniref:Uncharacterized protein n=1 Tax=Apophysomyces ossiformis TaxID=679940 RepID=A0A8H7EN39_9FUNG|nr:hypothetical protein EC973_003461 [Apophysomyces ossiformis]